MRILVSSCLIGRCCKYNGGSNDSPIVHELLKGHVCIPVCPEMLGGLGCPRTPCEIRKNRVIGQDGNDYTAAYVLGAEKACQIAQNNRVDLGILKRNSPSCGVTTVYDGSFSHTLIVGQGVFVKKLNRLQIPLIEI